MNKNEIFSCELLFKVLSNSTRLKIAASLIGGKKSVSEICTETGTDQARVSHELRCLTVCGLVDFARDGKQVIYSLNRETVLPILEAAGEHVKRFGDRMGSCDIISEAKRVKTGDVTL